LKNEIPEAITIDELFKDYSGKKFSTPELDWGEPQGNESW